MKTFKLLIIAVMTLSNFGSWAKDNPSSEPLQNWQMSQEELSKLDVKLREERLRLQEAMQQALEMGLRPDSLSRNYLHQQSDSETSIPKSVLNQILFSSMQSEVLEMQRYIFCSHQCAHSLEKDLADHPQRSAVLKALRSLWPRIKASFVLLYKDIPPRNL
jgi:hypothetical protein